MAVLFIPSEFNKSFYAPRPVDLRLTFRDARLLCERWDSMLVLPSSVTKLDLANCCANCCVR